ncbi:hypothetical protein [Oscillibacter sp.]|uniref:hypothetical protein n=1 Tax=Oscillibacter sp. TaxID=1945593 RepID=UPI0028A9F905|nr:hypothetical protein [Oscillibacter sp.]
MKHKVCYCLCGIIIIISVIIGIYNWLVLAPLRTQAFIISPWELIYIYAAKPAFWLCIGIVGALALFPLQVDRRFRKVSLWFGIAMVAAYCGVVVFSLMKASDLVKPSLLILPRLLKGTFAFLVPGILIGLGIDKKVS